MRARLSLVLWLAASACAPGPPLRAVIQVAVADDPARNTVLALPTTCEAAEPSLCEMAAYYNDPANVPRLTFDEIISPLVRLKLELAGYTVVDARTLRLETANRTDTTHDGETSTQVGDVPTVSTLSREGVFAAAASIHLGGVLVPTVHITRRSHEAWLELVLELRSVPDGVLQWTARCDEHVESPELAANLVAACVGDGVLAWRAPTALIGRAQ